MEEHIVAFFFFFLNIHGIAAGALLISESAIVLEIAKMSSFRSRLNITVPLSISCL